MKKSTTTTCKINWLDGIQVNCLVAARRRSEKNHSKKGRAYLGSQLKGTVHYGGDIVPAGGVCLLESSIR